MDKNLTRAIEIIFDMHTNNVLVNKAFDQDALDIELDTLWTCLTENQHTLVNLVSERLNVLEDSLKFSKEKWLREIEDRMIEDQCVRFNDGRELIAEIRALRAKLGK